MLGSMSRARIAKLALLAALLASDDAGAASRDRVRTEVRLYKVDVSATATRSERWTGPLAPGEPNSVWRSDKRIAWSATGRARVQATGRRGHWRHVALLGGSTLRGRIEDYDRFAKATNPIRLDFPEEPIPRWGGSCSHTFTTSRTGPSSLGATLGGTLRPVRLHAGVSEGAVTVLFEAVASDCPSGGSHPGTTMELGIARGEIDTLPLARRGCRRGGSFDGGWHQSCIATKRVVDRYGIAHTQTLDVEIVLARLTSRR
jgi:hypothetical protein